MDPTTEHGKSGMFELTERQWTDDCGPHIEISTLVYGQRFSIQLNHDVETGWDGLSAARESLLRAALAFRPAQPAAPDPSADGGGGGEPQSPLERALEDVLTRRCIGRRMDGYTRETAHELAALASRTPALGAAGVAGKAWRSPPPHFHR